MSNFTIAIQPMTDPWFTTYWVTRGEPKPGVQALVDERGARLVVGMDADQFFRRLADTLVLIDDVDRSAALPAALARAAVKRYVVDPSQRIRLEDLVTIETRKVLQTLETRTGGTPYRSRLNRSTAASDSMNR